MPEWNTSKRYPGVMWRFHPTRKVGSKPDRYFMIAYRINGQKKREAIGWLHAGWTEEKAAKILYDLKEAHRTGNGPATLQEKRDIIEAEKKQQQEQIALEASKNRTFDDLLMNEFFNRDYSERGKKALLCYYGKWAKAKIGHMLLKDITPSIILSIKKEMLDAGKSPRYTEMVLGNIRAVFNYAIKFELYDGKNPLGRDTKIDMPVYDNRKLRFLTRDEATALMDELKERSFMIYAISMVSLHAGLRFGEICSLKWSDIDSVNKTITVRRTIALKNTKNIETRVLYMTDALVELFDGIERRKPSDWVFPKKGDVKRRFIGVTFVRVVEKLKFNDGVTDRRQMFTFHSLRHTHASWLVQAGIDLFTISKQLGHTNTFTTMRYSHMDPERLKVVRDVFK